MTSKKKFEKRMSEVKWAKKLSDVLTVEEFGEFADFIDECDDVDFSSAIAEIDAVFHPEKYENITSNIMKVIIE